MLDAGSKILRILAEEHRCAEGTVSGMRRRVYEILTGPRPDDRLGRVISYALLALIAANVIASVLETDVEIRARAPELFDVFELVSVVVFTAELVLRVWSCTADPDFADGIRGRLRLLGRPMSVIDILAIAPFYIALLSPAVLDLRFLRALRLLRLFRMLRIRRVASAFSTLVRVITSRRAELGVTLAFVIVATLVAAGAMFVVERGEPGTQFTSIPRAMWWGICTVTTVGYGDIVPVTAVGRFIAGIVAFVGICAIALPVGILSSGFVDEINRKNRDVTIAAGVCTTCGRALE
ncbi:MAG: ion transporter [Kofleriaceae bacterium]